VGVGARSSENQALTYRGEPVRRSADSLPVARAGVCASRETRIACVERSLAAFRAVRSCACLSAARMGGKTKV
jgi:hypothetical protein